MKDRPFQLVAALMAAACGEPLTVPLEWALSADPIFEVGGLTDDPDYQLSEVVGATRMDDGRVVIADRMWHGLKLYSPEADFLRGVGGEGEGPGEFEYIRGIGRCAAGLIVAQDIAWDENQYTEELDFVGTRAASSEAFAQAPYQSACNEAGFVLATGWGDFATDFTSGYYVAKAPAVLTRHGDIVHHFGQRLSSERVGSLRPDGSPAGSAPHPFGRQMSVALSEERAFLGDAAGYLIEVYDLSGQRLDDIVWTGRDLTLRPEDFALMVDRAIADASASEQPRVRRFYAGLPEIERAPAYDRLLVDRIGGLWVRRFQRPGDAESLWQVFSPSGTQLGVVNLPLDSNLLEAGSDYILVAEHDEYDVPTVRVYALLKP